MVETGILLGYGNPLLDISVQTSTDYLEKYDLKADNAILAEEKHLPMYREMAQMDNVEYIPGGATLNSIRIAQWILGEPNATSFFGCISNDDFGKKLTDATKGAGVNVRFQINKAVSTGTCAVVCTDKNRSLVANLAAANHFTKDHLDDEENWKVVEQAKYIYFGGYPLTVCPEAMEIIAKHACDKNKVVLMNMSAPFLCEFFQEPMLKMLPYVDYWFGNESEALAFSKKNNLGTEDIKQIALAIANMAKENKNRLRTVIITQGSDPSVVVCDGKIQEFPVIPIKPEDIVDTNGAGDAFVGGFLASMVQGKNLADCMAKANEVANKVLHYPGCSVN